MRYKELKGKCKEYIEKELCLGCERLAFEDFEGDDNCTYIKEREIFEDNYKHWRINEAVNGKQKD